MNQPAWPGAGSPIVFLRPIGIAAGDAMRLMELAKRLRGPVRWRMAPPGVAADAYLVHSFSVNDKITILNCSAKFLIQMSFKYLAIFRIIRQSRFKECSERPFGIEGNIF